MTTPVSPTTTSGHPTDTPEDRTSVGRSRTEPPPRREVDSLLLVATGDGKGKSTAAFGTLLRAVSRGWPTSVVQFMKSGRWRVGEEDAARRLGVDWWTIGDGFTWESDDLDRSAAIARAAWERAATVLTSGDYRFVVLDEITYPVNYGWLDADEVWRTLRDRSPRTSVFCTGRNAPEELVALADTVTEMRKTKHAYETGVRARRGIDY